LYEGAPVDIGAIARGLGVRGAPGALTCGRLIRLPTWANSGFARFAHVGKIPRGAPRRLLGFNVVNRWPEVREKYDFIDPGGHHWVEFGPKLTRKTSTIRFDRRHQVWIREGLATFVWIPEYPGRERTTCQRGDEVVYEPTIAPGSAVGRRWVVRDQVCARPSEDAACARSRHAPSRSARGRTFCS